MANHTSIGLGAIAAGHAAEIGCLLTGIQAGETKWTTGLRPVVRKDDPPEEEDA